MNPRKPKLRLDDLIEFEAITNKQQEAISAYEKGYNLILDGSAGTGKTFLAMALAMEEVMDKNTPYERIIIVRSIVPTRDIGFLPGDEDEKKAVYEMPYRQICSELFTRERSTAYDMLKEDGRIEFITTSFIRGLTIRDAIVIIDEMQNCSWHELSSVATRMGNNTKLIACGDYKQTDLHKTEEQKGILQFLEVMREIKNTKIVTFGWEDIIRSDFVREFIMSCEMKKIKLN